MSLKLLASPLLGSPFPDWVIGPVDNLYIYPLLFHPRFSTNLILQPRAQTQPTMPNVQLTTSQRRRSTRTDYPSPTSTRSSGHSPSQYTLTVITSPSTSLTPSTTFNTRILISSRSSRRPSSPQGLLAVASLVADTPSGPQPLPAGYLMTSSPSSKLMDSVSEPSRQDLGAVARDRRDDVVGAVGFEDLCVREQGSFRVRVTLAQMTGDVYEAVAEVDSARFSVSGGGRVNGVKC